MSCLNMYGIKKTSPHLDEIFDLFLNPYSPAPKII